MNLQHHLRASLVYVLIIVHTLVLIIPLIAVTVLKLLLPLRPAQVACARILAWIAELWCAINDVIIRLISRPRLHRDIRAELHNDRWYLITANHQSWADILVLQSLFNRRIPFQKFFLKKELIWVPFLGLAWWALDFPFMKRHSKEELERRPELRGTDLETTRRACEKFQDFPTSVMNFFEGTRFTREKHQAQQSPYAHLLRPRAGGTAFALNAMGGTLRTLLDVTIIYPTQAPLSLTAFLGGAIRDVHVVVREREIPDWVAQGDYESDPEFRARFQDWINGLWEEKDRLIADYRRKGV